MSNFLWLNSSKIITWCSQMLLVLLASSISPEWSFKCGLRLQIMSTEKLHSGHWYFAVWLRWQELCFSKSRVPRALNGQWTQWNFDFSLFIVVVWCVVVGMKCFSLMCKSRDTWDVVWYLQSPHKMYFSFVPPGSKCHCTLDRWICWGLGCKLHIKIRHDIKRVE